MSTDLWTFLSPLPSLCPKNVNWLAAKLAAFLDPHPPCARMSYMEAPWDIAFLVGLNRFRILRIKNRFLFAIFGHREKESILYFKELIPKRFWFFDFWGRPNPQPTSHTYLKHEVHRDLEGGGPGDPERLLHVEVAVGADVLPHPDGQRAAWVWRRLLLVGHLRGTINRRETFGSLKSHMSVNCYRSVVVEYPPGWSLIGLLYSRFVIVENPPSWSLSNRSVIVVNTQLLNYSR